jgi:hypothetical protein
VKKAATKQYDRERTRAAADRKVVEYAISKVKKATMKQLYDRERTRAAADRKVVEYAISKIERQLEKIERAQLVIAKALGPLIFDLRRGEDITVIDRETKHDLMALVEQANANGVNRNG